MTDTPRRHRPATVVEVGDRSLIGGVGLLAIGVVALAVAWKRRS